MSERHFAPGSLLAERFRVVAERVSDSARVVDARDELSAGGRTVRLLLVRATVTARDLEAAVRRTLRYAVGVAGHAELGVAVEIEPGLLALSYAVPDGVTLDELTRSSAGFDSARLERLLGGVERALAPLHQQGIAHGYVCPEVIAETSAGGLVLGLGLAQAAAALGLPPDSVELARERPGGSPPTPSDDGAALAALRLALTRRVAPSEARPEAELPPSSPVFEAAANPAPASAPAAAAPPPALAPPARLPPSPAARAPLPLASVPDPTPSSAPARSSRWLGPLALGIGLLAMVGGVGTVFVLSKRLPAASSAALPAPLPPASAPLAPAPLLPAEPAPPKESAAPEDSAKTAPELPPISPPVRTRAPAVHAEAPLPVDDAQPSWGPADAPVTMTLFADLDCPHTRALLPELLRIKIALGNDLRWVFRHRPLSQHPGAAGAARLLAGVASELGSGPFWKLVAELARDPDASAHALMEQWLEQSDIPAEALARLESLPQARAVVEADSALGARLFIRSTPTLFINGVRIEGFQAEQPLRSVIERERRAGLFALLAGSPAQNVYVERTLRNFVNLGEDPPERACILEAGSPALGPKTAAVTLVEFCAYESSFCQKAEPALSALLARHPRDVKIVWKNFPISAANEGRLAANFALAARNAGGDQAFWAVHRALLDAHAAIDAPPLAQVAERLGLDLGGLLAAARSGAHDASLNADIELGRKLSVTGVPTVFINGRRKDGLLTTAELERLFSEELTISERVKEAGRGTVAELACAARGIRR